jgi:hypothetical protein
MRVDTSKKLFAGVRIDGRMRELLEKCPQRDRVYFEDPAGRYLVVLRGGDDTYLGKILDPAAVLASMDDVRRNIWSLMQRVCPGRRDENEVKLFALGDDVEEPGLSPRPGGSRPYPSSGPDRLAGRSPERSPERTSDRYGDPAAERPMSGRDPLARPRGDDEDEYF